MAIARVVIRFALLTVGTMPALAVDGRPAQYFSDRLIPEAPMVQYDRDWEAIARRLDAGVQATPTFGGGYLVGLVHDHMGWKLLGRGNQAQGPDAVKVPDATCSRPIGEKLGPKVMALWEKSLATVKPSQMIGLDGETFAFSLKGRKNVGLTWSPSLRDQPKMFRLSRIADGMFDACLTGRGLDSLDRQVSELLALM